jgi:Lipid A 3-O-deacylase (PagL)
MRTLLGVSVVCAAMGLVLGLPQRGRCADDSAGLARVTAEPSRGLWVTAGGAWTTAELFGGVHGMGRGVAVLELELTRTLKVGHTLAVDYLASVVPLELQTGTVVARDPGAPPGTSLTRTVYGAGLEPFGIGARYRSGAWRPYANAKVGFRIFTNAVPDPRASHFNFAIDLSLGVLRRVQDARWISLGLALHHVSNADLADSNPGLNQFVASVGLECFRQR